MKLGATKGHPRVSGYASTALRRWPPQELARMLIEGQGFWRIAVVTPANMPALAARMADGAAHDVLVSKAVDRLLKSIHALRSPARSAPLCLRRKTRLGRKEPPITIAVLTAYGDDARTAIAHGYCSTCCAEHSCVQMAQEIAEALRREMLPELRIVPAPSTLGHA